MPDSTGPCGAGFQPAWLLGAAPCPHPFTLAHSPGAGSEPPRAAMAAAPVLHRADLRTRDPRPVSRNRSERPPPKALNPLA